MYSSALETSSPWYIRPGMSGSSSTYYYEAMQVKVMETATYIFHSNSIIDTYGYIYKDSFNPCNPVLNLISQDDDSGAKMDFQLTSFLQASTTYILVVTTYIKDVTGNFSILVSVPNNVNFSYFGEYIYCAVNNQYRSTKIQKIFVSSIFTLIPYYKYTEYSKMFE